MLKNELLISAKGIVKKYGNFVAVNGVDLDVYKSEVFGLLGPNGAGKTTLISILSTILQPDEGTATICGYDLIKEKFNIRHAVSLVPQDLALYLSLSAYENLDFYASLYGLKGTEKKKRIDEVLDITRLGEWAKKKVSTYSGGMKRRLNIAVGLLNHPKLLFLDEPTVGVDPQSRNHIFSSIRYLVKDLGMSVIYTTHYMEEAQELCDRVAIYDGGKILDLEPTQELLRKHGGKQIEMNIPDEKIAHELQERFTAVDEIQSVVYKNGKLSLQANDLLTATDAVIQEIKSQNVQLEGFRIQETNLESVFLKLTGKTLRDE